MSLETVPNDIDDATHLRLDERVLADLDGFSPTWLLSTIVSTSEGRLNPDYRDLMSARKLIDDHSELKSMLEEAWSTKSFKDIRNLKILCPPHRLPSLPRRGSRILNAEVQQRAISNAWDQPYEGDMHSLLLTNINRMLRGQPYSNSATILQSSGSGKSRMVREQSSLVFTLPFNLRDHSDSQNLAYPPPDGQIRSHLDWAAFNLHEGQTHYLHFLGHLFRAVSEELYKLFPKKSSSYATLAAKWRSHLEKDDNRARIYDRAVKGCSSTDLVHLQTLHPAKCRNIDPADLYAVSEEAKSQLTGLLQAIDTSCETMGDYPSNGVKLMIYFDEAHVLANRKVPHDPDGNDMYDVLCSCFNLFVSFPLFVIFLSTNSNLSRLGPQESLARSARARNGADSLQAPITETPFDCAPTLPVTPGQLALKDVYQIEFMAQFGRPMFWTLLAGAANRQYEIMSTIIDLARAKLICSHKIHVGYTHMGPVALTAVLDVLLNLDYEPRLEAARNREAELVAGHMRTAFSVPKDRECVRSGYPSEPILAEAAACQMDEFQKHSPDTNVMAYLLQKNFSNGLLDQGFRGEVVFRQLVSEAYRRAVRTDHRNDCPLIFSKGCKLITFITELFSEDCATQILNSMPDNVKDETKFSAAFADSVIRFTHFGKMADDTGTTSHAMFAAFVRCMAVICVSSQDTVDILIPVLLDSGAKLEESAMTGILIQIKRRKAKGTRVAYDIHQNAVGFFPPDSKVVRPYITLVAELGVQPRISPTAGTRAAGMEAKEADVGKPGTSADPQTPSNAHISSQPSQIKYPDVHPRYSIFAYGCSHTVYGVVAPADRWVYAFLLGNCDFLDEHARKDAGSLSAVRRMKPFWSVGADCYHWVNEPFLQQTREWHDDPGELRVGEYTEDDVCTS